MKPTYTRKQLEALRDCLARKCTDCTDMVVDCVNTQRTIKGTLASDLISALDEIERLRTALEWYTNARGADGDYIGERAIDALKETTNER